MFVHVCDIKPGTVTLEYIGCFCPLFTVKVRIVKVLIITKSGNFCK